MGQTLSHGVYLPNEGERNCYAGLASNWQILNTAVGAIAEKAPLVHTHTKSDITDFPAYGTTAGTICEGNDSRLSDARTPVAHTHTKSDVTDLFNSANTWSAKNTYSADCIVYNSDNSGSVPGLKLRNSKAEILSTGNTASDQSITFRDKNDVAIGYIRGAVQSTSVALKIGTYAKDSSNNNVNTELQLLAYPNGNKAIFPSTTDAYNLGSSSYQWNNLYAKNYYYNGVAWGLDKQNVWTSAQKIAANPAIWDMKNTTYTLGTSPSGNKYSGFIFYDSADTDIGRLTLQNHKNGNNYYIIGLKNSDGTNTYDGALRYSASKTNERAFYPEGDTDLGTTNNPWKTINGINPGALSLPDVFDSYDVVTTNWSTAYNQPNDLKINGADPSYPGWLFIRLDNCTAADDFVIVRYFHVNAANLTFFGSFIPTASSYVLSVPIQAGITTKVWVSKIPATCKYYACLGTVK